MTGTSPSWRFARMTPSEMNQDPVQGEFFTAASDLPERLVRESIQNSLDARLPGSSEPVLVRFGFSAVQQALPAEESARYLAGLEPHLAEVALESLEDIESDPDRVPEEQDALLEAHQLLKQPMDFLVVEDFGTFGLQGDLDANSAYEEANHFWGFFRSVGISPKPEDAGGSWGLGKWVFPDASRLNTFLGITLRKGEGQPLLMGQAVLKTHTIDHDGEIMKYPAYGSFGAPSTDPDHEWLPLPISDQGLIRKAQMHFNLHRQSESGLSVIIPFPKADLTPAAVERAVLTQYFLPVVSGALVVEIEHPGVATKVIDATTIDEAVLGIAESERDDESAESLSKAIKLAREAIRSDQLPLIEAKASLKREELLNGQDLEALRDRFNRGEVLTFKMSSGVTRKHNKRTLTSFRVFLERDEDLSEGHDYFVRGNLRIPQMDHIKNFPARALVLVEGESELGHLLRDAEGPAHVSWDPHAQRLKERWSGGYGRVQEVRRAVPLLLQSLVEIPQERLKNLLIDLFPAPSGLPTVALDQDDDDSSTTVPPVSRSRSNASLLAITRLKDGFSVHSAPSHPKLDSLPGTSWRVSFAYDVARGGQRAAFNSFKQGAKQGSPDFSLYGGYLRIAARGCRYEIASDNEIVVKVATKEFGLSVTGLDHRDVVTDVHEIAPSWNSEEE